MAGTIAVHVLIITAGDALVVTNPPRPFVPPPHIELVEIEVPPVLAPPPPPPPAPEPPAPVAPAPAPRPQIARAVPSHPRSAPEPAPAPPEAPAVASGGDHVVQMDDIAPSATGVGVGVGKPATEHIGRGGSGGGTGAGSGSGTAEPLAKPVSIASIKTRALPKRDYSTDAGTDYPAEAKALGIEGDIRVRLVVDERGVVQSRVLLNKLGHGLDELAMKRAGAIEFIPAKDTDDRPVASVVVWTFHMVLPAS